MFPELQKKFVRLYTLSTGLILTFILGIAFLFYISSLQSRQESSFADHIFTLTSKLQTESTFTDSYLSQLEVKHHLLIYIEENDTPFFYPGVYQTQTEREKLLETAKALAEKEGISENAHPFSSNLLQSSIFEFSGENHDTYLGNVLIIQSPSGYKKLILLQDITANRMRLIMIGIFYILINVFGIILLFLTGRQFVRRSLKPLEEMYKKQQDFVASASHELRSPLAVIQSAADTISNTPQNCGKFLEIIKSECRRGTSLVKNLLLLASVQEKNWAVKKQFFEIDEMLLHLMELYEPLCNSKNGVLLLELPENTIPRVFADPELCMQIFTILLDNAISYGLADVRKIILSAEYSHSHTIIRVKDFGPGILDEEKALIFDPFYRNNKARNQKEHFGLGLSIAINLAEIQDMKLNITDTPGGGSTFEVTING